MNLKRPLFVSIAVLLVVFWSDFLLARESVLTIQAKEENGTPVPGLKLFDTETGHASGRTNKEGFTTLPIDSRVGSTVRLGISPNKDGKLEWDFVSPENGDLIIPEGFSAQITLRRRTSLPDSLKLYIKDAEDQPISNIRIRNKKTSKTSRLSAEGFTALPLLPTERPGSIIRLAIAPDTTSGTVDWVWVEPPKGETPIPEDFYCEIILKRRTTSPDTVGIAVPNRRPRADAGADLVGYLGETLHLDGSSSLDQDDDPLRWNWRQVAGPLAALNRTLGRANAFHSAATRAILLSTHRP